jgi:hypothetical protein
MADRVVRVLAVRPRVARAGRAATALTIWTFVLLVWCVAVVDLLVAQWLAAHWWPTFGAGG